MTEPPRAGTNLARAADPFVGRAADLRELGERFDADERLITITGPGGMGKTRLAVELGLSRLEGPEPARSGAWLCDLTEARGLLGICDAVAGALGAGGTEPAAGGDPVLRIGRAIATRGDVLLVLDNFDALTDHALATVGRWLALAPEAAFLVTSRERLKLPGEIVHELGPLGLPEGGASIPGAEAVDLFVGLARRARHDYSLTTGEAPFVAEIVRELEGVPLAIELAAPRMAVMGARALLHRLRSRADVMRRNERGKPERHATLEAAIDGSWSALTAAEQDALAQCAVFRGGFSIDAAEAVIDLGAHAGAPPILEVVQALRDRSLLHATSSRGMPGELRLGAYASVRDYASQKLEASGAARAVEARHAEHFVALAEGWARRLDGPEGPEHRGRLMLERENLLAVVDRVLGRGAVTARTAEPALRALLALAPVLLHEGPLHAYVALIDPALDATRDSGADPRLQGHALALRGSLQRQRGEGPAAARDLVQALAIARTIGDARLEAKVTIELGLSLERRGDLEAARDHHERALAAYEALGDRGGAAHALGCLGALAARRGDQDQARTLLERALATREAEGDAVAAGQDHGRLGLLDLDASRHAEAEAHLRASLSLCRRGGDRKGEALAGGWLGLLAHDRGELATAREAYEAAAAMLAELGFTPLEATFTGLLGVVAREEGKIGVAYTLLASASAGLPGEAEASHAGLFLAHRAGLDAAAGRQEPARALLARARELAGAGGDPAMLAVVDLEQSALEGGGGTEAAGRDRSVHARIAARCVAHARASTPPPPPPPEDALLVGATGTWFRAPRGERVSLERRRPLALLLSRLTRERLERPGHALQWDELLESGWPGEKVQAAAGAHRVRVAVSTLRKLGLRELLKTVGEGYVLPEQTLVLLLD